MQFIRMYLYIGIGRYEKKYISILSDRLIWKMEFIGAYCISVSADMKKAYRSYLYHFIEEFLTIL